MRWHAAVAVVVWAVLGLAIAVSITSAFGWWSGGYAWGNALLLVVFLTTIVAGSSLQALGPHVVRTVDVGGTAALALAVTYSLPAGPVVLTTTEVVGVVLIGLVLGGLLDFHSFSGPVATAVLGRALPRVLTVAILSLGMRDLGGDRALVELVREGQGSEAQLVALALVGVLYVALLLEAPLRAEFLRRPGEPRRTVHMAALMESVTLGVVPASTAVLVATAERILGLPALPLLLLPLVFNQVAVRRHEEMKEHTRQSVVALSRLPEAMGLVRPGHAARVAHTAGDIGRQLGLGRRDIADLERAALLHDLGQVRLDRPVPSGATVLAAPADQEDIALHGAAIARATGVLEAESHIIETQSLPYRHHVSHTRRIPLGGRILKVANAYDDLLTGTSAGLPLETPGAVLERIYLGLGHEYDPRVVDALDKSLHGGRTGGRDDGVSGGGVAGRDAPRT